MHILFFSFTLIKDVFMLKATLAILKIKFILLHFKRIGGNFTFQLNPWNFGKLQNYPRCSSLSSPLC